ncbi:AAA family ATPase [bacterium]|nr:AAA family ATPase [bacterium]MBT6832339.1 AAA family ATPase [bacterium]MBT6996434.1 AAA family ATPase [bacterium]MBT7772745.1 AAA family ATPase [bacterium]
MTDLILVGKQGSGKGTQAKILAKKFGYQIFETGAALRKIANATSELGQKVKEITTRGDLVPNEIVMEIVREFLKNADTEKSVIFDGIPRSEEQRQTLEKLLGEMGREFLALEIKLSNGEAMERLMMRAHCNECGSDFGSAEDECPRCGSFDISRRADDNPESISTRLENFEKYTAPLLDKWKTADKLISVNGEQPVNAVTTEMLAKLNLT